MWCGFGFWYLLVACALLLCLRMGLCRFVGADFRVGWLGLCMFVVGVACCLFCGDDLGVGVVDYLDVLLSYWWVGLFEL